MRLFGLSLLACVLASACAAAAVAQEPPGVEVRGFEWRPVHRNVRRDDTGLKRSGDYSRNDPANPERRERGLPGSDPGRLEMPSPPARAPRRAFYGYESSVHLKQNGAQAVRAIEWEHVFFVDQERRKELKRFRFRREARIEPGAQKFVAQVVAADAYSRLPPRSRQSVIITRVEYADGSVWQR